ncbi:putative Ecp7(P20) [Drepanopeziza brunnea f. sp. 'multigermtubi' MB_m1]|uniref:Ecp9 n=2 Tax=Drepanopeziza brunnea f. sp. 'multigermtubi' TaxID=698441 RepID=D2XZ22_9HELO|nr:putative Ecp7(P20) [Drepanopeziza brunnea f. sp. 'multigermtubi' MB_m1]ADB23425.1 Ecp9 [Drepanopeziza brunnea f. sp. 'multigermtubi']AFS30725.1 LysM07p [Drepanopeziza brunnea f. sp. 'multigermtubi']EKD15059.1 putative Ecp7(P20) [Drepanopeziza brunnea f. sp. 'multigermtubi' MB_m1]
MRFNNNIFLLASFLGVATALRRSCHAEEDSSTGEYQPTDTDTLQQVAGDFCVDEQRLLELNENRVPKKGQAYKVPCYPRKRDCAKITGSLYGYYTMTNEDSYKAVGQDFCINTYDLKALNPEALKDDLVHPGMVVLVPCAWN